MKDLLNRLFSDRYANHGAIGHNLLLLAMYRLAYPFAVLLNAARLSPNQITVLSGLSAVGAAAALVFAADAWPFAVLWGVSLLLDFCDGTVARMSSRVSTNAFRFDHMSDLAKVSLLVVAAAARYQTFPMWIVSSVAMFGFLYYAVISQELKTVTMQSRATSESPSGGGFQARLPLPVRVLYTAVATINGHTLLVFFALPLGPSAASMALAYLAAVSLLGVALRVRILLRTPRPRRT